MIKMLTEDNDRIRKAGCELAEAALYTIKEYDGLHRLSLAVSNWAKAVADEGNRSAKSIEKMSNEGKNEPV